MAQRSTSRFAVALTLVFLAGAVLLSNYSVLAWQSSASSLSNVVPTGQLAASPSTLPRNTPELIIGQATAPLTLTLYGDMLCADCRRFANEVVPILNKEYLATGLLKIQFIPVPFSSPEALTTGAALYCAGEQSGFSRYYIRMSNVSDVSRTNLIEQAAASNLDANSFARCLDSGRFEPVVRANTNDARSRSLIEVPAFIFGGRILRGFQPASVFETLVSAQGRP